MDEPSTSGNNTVQTFFDEKQGVGKAKHKILSSYLGTWFALLNQNTWRTKGRYSYNNPQYTRIVYVDGFSGPGFYSNGIDPGSPAVVYELALTHKSLSGEPQIFLIFIEKNVVHCQALFTNLSNLRVKHLGAKNANKVKFMVINDEFVNAMIWILSPEFKFPLNFFAGIFKVNQCHYEPIDSSSIFVTYQTPLFVFVDPFGYNGEHMPMTLMQYILERSEKAELLINIMTGFIRRFFNLDNRTRPINLLVGIDENDSSWKPIVLEVGDDSHDKLNTFLHYYQSQISSRVPGEIFMPLFEKRNKRNQLLYNLLHVTRHSSGFDAMKKAMRTSSQSDYSFKYSTYQANKPDFTREVVEIEFLKQEILEHFTQNQFVGRVISGSEISSFLNAHSFLYQRYKNVLKKCLEEYIVTRNDVNVHMMRFDEINFKFA